jgi:hypothetical protein
MEGYGLWPFPCGYLKNYNAENIKLDKIPVAAVVRKKNGMQEYEHSMAHNHE